MSLPTQARLLELFDYSIMSGKLYRRITTSNNAKAGSVAGGRTINGYVTVSVDNKPCLAHRLIWCLVTGEWPKGVVDHADHSTANNSWHNLREATYPENSANRGASRTSKTGLKGVCICPTTGKYYAMLGIEGDRLYLGRHDTPEQAKEAYDTAAKQYHGEFYHA